MIKCFVKNGTPDGRRRDCVDCQFRQAAIGWWCVNKKAHRRYGAAACADGIYGCDFWAPTAHIEDVGCLKRLACLPHRPIVIDLNAMRALADLPPTPLHPKEAKT